MIRALVLGASLLAIVMCFCERSRNLLSATLCFPALASIFVSA